MLVFFVIGVGFCIGVLGIRFCCGLYRGILVYELGFVFVLLVLVVCLLGDGWECVGSGVCFFVVCWIGYIVCDRFVLVVELVCWFCCLFVGFGFFSGWWCCDWCWWCWLVWVVLVLIVCVWLGWFWLGWYWCWDVFWWECLWWFFYVCL